jgi:23S rRNA pseudouridine2604 synthase
MERVAKLMAQRGLCSRREAERLIDAGQVEVDGVKVTEQGSKARPDADIRITAAGEQTLGQRLTVVLHKPVGVVSMLPEPGQTPAWKLLRRDTASGAIDPAELERIVAAPSTLSVAGRLDRASRGLLVLTQDGAVARRIVGGNGVRKKYVVRTAENVGEEQVRKLCGPLVLDDRPLLPMSVRRVGPKMLRFVLVEGRKHQIRRVCRKVGLNVTDLYRESIGPLRIGDLLEGTWRLATAGEIADLLAGSASVRPPRP